MTTEQLFTVLFSGGAGAVLVALINKFRGADDRRALQAAADKDEATGEAAVIGAMATAFTGTTTALRQEIERMQTMLDDLRSRVIQAEAELRAAAAREAAQERLIADQKAQLEMCHGDVVRLRAERDTAVSTASDKVTQQEGEIRTLKATIDAMRRASA